MQEPVESEAGDQADDLVELGRCPVCSHAIRFGQDACKRCRNPVIAFVGESPDRRAHGNPPGPKLRKLGLILATACLAALCCFSIWALGDTVHQMISGVQRPALHSLIFDVGRVPVYLWLLFDFRRAFKKC